MRKMASIQIIKAIRPIENADSIEVAEVLGWNVVVKKGDFTPGDWVVYCEVDSVLPERPEFEFLKNKRIKTIRLRGQISQGIVFPLSILPVDITMDVGMDCTEILGITKYEPIIPAELAGIAKGEFPKFIPKTDETRVQILQDVLTRYKGTKCYITEKLDGMSATFFIKDGVFGVCSRNLELIESDTNALWKIARAYNIEEKLRSIGKDIAIQGEAIGNGINKNLYKISGYECKFFNAFDISTFKYYDFLDMTDLLASLELPMVPLLNTEYELIDDIQQLVRDATIKSTLIPTMWAEGIVIRPLTEAFDFQMANLIGNNGRVSFKAINPEFSLKYDS